jgi:hypothetical protein
MNNHRTLELALWHHFGQHGVTAESIEVLYRNAENIRQKLRSDEFLDAIVVNLLKRLGVNESTADVLECVAKALEEKLCSKP